MKRHWTSCLGRLAVGFAVAWLLVSANHWLTQEAGVVALEPLPAGAFLTGVLGGPYGVVGYFLGHALQDWQQAVSTGQIEKKETWETIETWASAAPGYALLGLIGFLVFRFGGRVGRGFPDWRSVVALTAAGFVGGLAATFLIALLRAPSLSWELILTGTASNAASIIFVAPPLMLLANRYLRHLFFPFPDEYQLSVDFPENLRIQPMRSSIPMAGWVVIICAGTLLATGLVIPLTDMAPTIGGWPLLGYLGIVIGSALAFGLRGGLLASSLAAVCYFTARLYIDREVNVFDEGNLFAAGLYIQFATFYLVAIVLGALRENEVRLRWQTVGRDRMSELLQSADDPTEAYGIIQQSLRKLFPGQHWVLLELNESDVLFPVAQGEDGGFNGRACAVSDCWALRMGHAHAVTDDAEGARCAHVHDDVERYICYPLVAHSETLGILHLALDDPDEDFLQSLVRMISLSLGNIKAHQELKDQSIRDALTGLVNRRYLVEQLELEVARAGREDKEISLLILDIDHFKHFNDTYGHEAGDEVLRGVGKYLNAHARQGDVICRYGGEEFVIVMPGAPVSVAKRRAEDFRRGIRDLRLRSGGQSLGQVTASFGVATWPVHGGGWRQVLEIADLALYEAKKGGRDRVETAPEPQRAPSAVTA